jgi:hypothetical protein
MGDQVLTTAQRDSIILEANHHSVRTVSFVSIRLVSVLSCQRSRKERCLKIICARDEKANTE